MGGVSRQTLIWQCKVARAGVFGQPADGIAEHGGYELHGQARIFGRFFRVRSEHLKITSRKTLRVTPTHLEPRFPLKTCGNDILPEKDLTGFALGRSLAGESFKNLSGLAGTSRVPILDDGSLLNLNTPICNLWVGNLAEYAIALPRKISRVDGLGGGCYNPAMNAVLREATFPTGQEFQIVAGDLTQEQVDAIVNAANSRLQHGAGVAGVIVSRGGRQIQQESNAWVREHGPISHAQPAYTSAGRLPCKFVIHAVGPIWGEGAEDQKLGMAVRGALQCAEKLELKSIALPAISTGIFGFPKPRAAQIIFETIPAYFAATPESGLAKVRLTLWDKATLDIFLQVWDAR